MQLAEPHWNVFVDITRLHRCLTTWIYYVDISSYIPLQSIPANNMNFLITPIVERKRRKAWLHEWTACSNLQSDTESCFPIRLNLTLVLLNRFYWSYLRSSDNTLLIQSVALHNILDGNLPSWGEIYKKMKLFPTTSEKFSL